MKSCTLCDASTKCTAPYTLPGISSLYTEAVPLADDLWCPYSSYKAWHWENGHTCSPIQWQARVFPSAPRLDVQLWQELYIYQVHWSWYHSKIYKTASCSIIHMSITFFYVSVWTTDASKLRQSRCFHFTACCMQLSIWWCWFLQRRPEQR